MTKDNINISKIESILNEYLEGIVSDNVFFGSTIDASIVKSSEWTDMIVVEMPNGISDMDAFGGGTVLVWLYAKPLSSGRKNVSKMSKLESSLNESISLMKSDGYSVSRRLTYTDYDTEINWHCNVVELQILIV